MPRPGNFGGGSVKLEAPGFLAEMGEPEGISAETIGENHVGTGIDISAGDGGHIRRSRKIPGFRAITGLEPAPMQKGPPGSIGNQNLAAGHGVPDDFGKIVHNLFTPRARHGRKAPGKSG
jgi:hypothetical protein